MPGCLEYNNGSEEGEIRRAVHVPRQGALTSYLDPRAEVGGNTPELVVAVSLVTVCGADITLRFCGWKYDSRQTEIHPGVFAVSPLILDFAELYSDRISWGLPRGFVRGTK